MPKIPPSPANQDPKPITPCNEIRYLAPSAISRSKELPEHRRIDRRKVRISTAHRGGHLSLTLKVAGSDFEYVARKFIHLVHEVYLSFLNDGRYYSYMLRTFDLDPDKF